MASKPHFIKSVQRLLTHDAAGGVLLFVAMIFALVLDNSPLASYYGALLDTTAGVRIGELKLEKAFVLWINDGLMAIFFLLVGLEIKREVLEGHLSKRSQIVLPAIAGLGGMVVPALIYAAINRGDAMALNGWAIPAATDIAFALGVLSLFGKRVPSPLKIFLLALAILDDLGAIVIIAIFYTSNLSLLSLALAAGMLLILALLNHYGVTHISAYAVVGIALWVCVLKSGVHATLAGVALAFAIPLRARDADGHQPLVRLEHALHPWVYLVIMPVFAFANSGVSLAGLTLDQLLEPVPLGIAAGLFLGKQIGVFGFTWIGVLLGLTRLPEGIRWRELYGVSLLCGIGFTMSLFIGSLAFGNASMPEYASDVRLGILSGSLLSGLLGGAVLRWALGNRKAADQGSSTDAKSA